MISVIMPCYNASAYLREAIKSVLSQSYEDWELLIVDDGSTDNSTQIAKKYTECDPRIRMIEQPNGGACRARNNGIIHAQGQYVKFLDADDVLSPNCLAEQVQQIEQLSSNQIPFGDYGHMASDGKALSNYQYSREQLDLLNTDQVRAMFIYWQILISAPLHRLDWLKKIGGFDTNLPRHQETDFHFRLALAGLQFIYYPTFTFYYREYTSPHRITSNYRSGKINEAALQREIYVPQREALLLDKYGSMPQVYRPYFSNCYFDSARYYFAHKQMDRGNRSLAKAIGYGELSLFMRFYISAGKIIGYARLESLFQFRLRLLGKI